MEKVGKIKDDLLGVISMYYTIKNSLKSALESIKVLEKEIELKDLQCIDDMIIMALTVYGEARGEGENGMSAVAWVIKNRVDDNVLWNGETIRQVCLCASQFSVWNKNDINRQKLTNIILDNDFKKISNAYEVCQKVMSGFYPDNSLGSTHYYSTKIFKNLKQDEVPSSWGDAENFEFKTEIGKHRFYKELLK